MRLAGILTGLLLAAAGWAAPAVPSAEVPFRRGGIAIDGKPGDPGWKNAARIVLAAEPLNQRFGDYWATRPTTVLLAYDETFIYIAFLCRDDRIVTAGEKHDDALHAGDVAETFIDGTGDYRQFFEIQQNAAGLARDVNYLFTGFNNVPDEDGYLTDWNNIWEDICCDIRGLRFAGGKLADGSGWFTELAIPAPELLRRSGRRQFAPGMTLRANFVRLDCSGENRSAAVSWSPTVFGRPHRSPGRMGFLKLLPR